MSRTYAAYASLGRIQHFLHLLDAPPARRVA
jgi:hypothetical protein